MGHQKMHQKSYSNHKNRRKIRIFIYQTCENWIFYRPGSHFWSLKSIKNQNKVETNLTFSPILHKFQSNNGEKREKSNSAKIWALLLFSSLFSRLLFSRFLFEFKNSMILKNSNDFCHSYAGFILATSHGMLLRHQNAIFEKKFK
jgi:hypothetical protein